MSQLQEHKLGLFKLLYQIKKPTGDALTLREMQGSGELTKGEEQQEQQQSQQQHQEMKGNQWLDANGKRNFDGFITTQRRDEKDEDDQLNGKRSDSLESVEIKKLNQSSKEPHHKNTFGNQYDDTNVVHKEKDVIIELSELDIDLKNKRENAKEFSAQETLNATEKESGNQKEQPYRAFKTMSSSVLDDNYFKEDTDSNNNFFMKRAQADVDKIKDYFMEFRMGQFFETFFIHFCYYTLIGPLIVPILMAIRGKWVVYNLMFVGLNRYALEQFVVFATNIGCIFLFFYYQNPRIKSEIELMNNISSVMFRCVLIACKYATFDPMKMKVLRNFYVPFDQITKDFFLTHWVKQTCKVIAEQVHYAQRSFDIDPGLFFIQFIIEPDASTQKRLSKCSTDLDTITTENKMFKKPEPPKKIHENDVFYCCYKIIVDMINIYERKNANNLKFLIFIINTYVVVRGFTPICYNLITYGWNAYSTWHEYFIAFSSAFQLITLYYSGSKIMIYSVIDLKRKLFMMRQVTFMIAPRKLRDFDMKKLYPTVNIFRGKSLKGWYLLRKVVMEYGKPYSLRIQGFFFFLGIWVVINLMQIVMDQYNISPLNTAQQIQTYLDTTFVLSCVFGMLIVGSQINDLFNTQESILNSNRTIVTDLLLVSKKYISKQLKSPSFIYNKAIEKVLEVTDNYEEHINDLIEKYNNHIEELNFDDLNNPFTLFGLKVTFTLLQSILIALISVIASIISSMIFGN